MLNYKTAKRELSEITTRFQFVLDQQASIESLSLGERQQLELTPLLVGGAQLLILDEPTTGISADQKEKLFASIKKLARDEEKR